MLQNGLSRDLFEAWCTDKRNGVVLPGYCVEGTLAKKILSEPSHIMTASGLRVPLNMSVNYVSFSAHGLCANLFFSLLFSSFCPRPHLLDRQTRPGRNFAHPSLPHRTCPPPSTADYEETNEFIKLLEPDHIVRPSFLT